MELGTWILWLHRRWGCWCPRRSRSWGHPPRSQGRKLECTDLRIPTRLLAADSHTSIWQLELCMASVSWVDRPSMMEPSSGRMGHLSRRRESIVWMRNNRPSCRLSPHHVLDRLRSLPIGLVHFYLRISMIHLPAFRIMNSYRSKSLCYRHRRGKWRKWENIWHPYRENQWLHFQIVRPSGTSLLIDSLVLTRCILIHQPWIWVGIFLNQEGINLDQIRHRSCTFYLKCVNQSHPDQNRVSTCVS